MIHNKSTVVRLLAMLVPMTIFAAMPAQANNSAIRIDDQLCGLLDGEGNPIVSASGHGVITSRDRQTVKCQIQSTPTSSGRAVRWNFDNTGFVCFGFNGATSEDWQITVSASGLATGTCRISS